MTFSAAAGCPLSVDSISRIAKVSETPTEYAEAFFSTSTYMLTPGFNFLASLCV